MKIKKNVILEMADNRKKALDDIETTGFSLYEHIMKCVLYRERKDFLNDWYKTIGNLCSVINDRDIKGGTLKEKDYLKVLLSFDSISDCSRDIRGFYLNQIVTKEKYPPFINRSTNAEDIFNIYRGFILKLSKVVSTKNNYDNKYFANMFKEYFESKINDLEEDFDETNLFTLL